jgi:ubiquinone/menaquinone biosynthesis C-methylase UbiE
LSRHSATSDRVEQHSRAMPSLEENKQAWGREESWPMDGEGWSSPWGTSAAQWRWCLLPRIGAFIPADTILEIGPGHGRWTRFIKDQCSSLVVVDLSPSCIEVCKRRFATDTHISYHVTDGTSLDMVEDGSIDFVFSFDSLVHAEADVIAAYLRQLAQKLRPDGVGFIHHSNTGRYRRYFNATDSVYRREFFARAGLLDTNHHFRARSMTAELFEQLARAAGLKCIGQEIVNWNTRRLIDTLSIITLPGSRLDRSNVVLRNPDFMREAAHAARMEKVYL